MRTAWRVSLEPTPATIVAGVGSNDTRHAIDMTERATEIGADALLHVNPYYNRPSRRGIVAHYREVVRATNLPILLYNIPQRTGSDLPNELLAELAQLPNIVAVKQANASNLARIADDLQELDEHELDVIRAMLERHGLLQASRA